MSHPGNVGKVAGQESIVPSGGGEGPAMLGTMAGAAPPAAASTTFARGATGSTRGQCVAVERLPRRGAVRGQGCRSAASPTRTSPDLCNYLCLWHCLLWSSALFNLSIQSSLGGEW